ncbi:MAG: PilW family protein [Nitrospirae bacterium]|nr:PilW family protein [Nitrospirota bacterium]
MKALRKEDGFSLTELIVTMVVFVIVIAAASNIFVGILGQFKQQSKIAESNIEGLIGLQMLKTDVEQAGFGLPWNIGTATYAEAVNSGNSITTWDDTLFNDSSGNPPRPFVFGDGGVIANPPLNGSDVLVVKAANIGTAQATQRWTYITNIAATNAVPSYNTTAARWMPDTANENLANGDRVIAIKPVSGTREREMVLSGGANFTIFDVAAYSNNTTIAAGFQPVISSSETHLFYGLGTENLRMPFNRADFYVKRPAVMPSQCSADAGTGILYKATINHADGERNELPLLDCVREMQVVFAYDTTSDGDTSPNAWGPLPVAMTVPEMWNQLREVRIYILAHEGSRDNSYTSSALITATDPNWVGPNPGGAIIYFNAATAGLRNFRWKVFTIVAKPYMQYEVER